MATINLNVQRVKGSSVGSLNWTIEQLNALNLSVTTLKSGALCICTVDENQKVVDIIAVEEINEKGNFRRFQGSFSYDKEGEKSYSSTPYYRIWYVHETETIIEESYDGFVYGRSLFGECLTQASKNLVWQFISLCVEILLGELIKRDSEEARALENIKISVQ